MVTSIAVAPDRQVTVTCQGGKQLQSNAVVVAVPLKVRLCIQEAANRVVSRCALRSAMQFATFVSLLFFFFFGIVLIYTFH